MRYFSSSEQCAASPAPNGYKNCVSCVLRQCVECCGRYCSTFSQRADDKACRDSTHRMERIEHGPLPPSHSHSDRQSPPAHLWLRAVTTKPPQAETHTDVKYAEWKGCVLTWRRIFIIQPISSLFFVIVVKYMVGFSYRFFSVTVLVLFVVYLLCSAGFKA